ncbi:5-formyltetrahydrofolate cyclo-ligase [Aliiruegeria haliotis]|uniref:5-formyltetrahydrofolate cyclo-ligase n=1 Tax=Aliiruegeria haliotis TaxID=1280846 RepID=A0A2T0RQZ1_9RHOB|nr:5-formyltetrahydrofolate cyclo-ligase [Aliiruegeria haliotis]PRY23588.1 5-formyltetrahydrofolate cyclo-ligase [Aliiruegeria haliotis]
MNLAERKATERAAAYARRKTAHARHRAAASAQLESYLRGVTGQVIAGYLPIRTEADPLPAMGALSARNRICVPVVEGHGCPLTFRDWRPGCALEEGSFKVMIPVGGAVLVPNVLIVPLVAFDAGLYRLGYGGGFYDRTLERLRATGPVRAIGFAYGDQQTEALPLEPTDQRLDEVVTENGVLPLDP